MSLTQAETDPEDLVGECPIRVASGEDLSARSSKVKQLDEEAR